MKRYSVILLVVFAVACVQSAIGQIDRSKKPEPAPTPKLTLPKIQRTTLANGLNVMLVEHRELPVVQMQMVIMSGAVNDPEGKSGLANLTAQMLDEGTKRRTALQIADDVDFIGANLSINATVDATYANLLTLKEHLVAAMDIYADVLLNPTFPESEWDRVKKTHLTTLLQQKDLPAFVADRIFNHVTFGERHPYGRSSLGNQQSVEGITIDDMKRFYAAHYLPNNATLIVVGDVSLKEITTHLDNFFKTWKKGETVAASFPSVPAIGGNRIYLVDKPQAAQSEIRIGHEGVRRNNEDYFPLVVLNTILGGQFSSRINMNLRETKGYTYGARSAFAFWKNGGPFIASSAVRTNVTDSSIIEFMKELRRIVDEDVTEKEINFAKNSLIRREPQNFETPQQIAGQLVVIALHNLPDNYFDTYVQNFEKVSIADVRRVAKKYLNPASMNIVIVGDVATIKDGLEKLGYGKAQLLDPDGKAMN
ncbi:MAG TPA: pitrilysin family protein [Bacteroidota bacterium]|nr:pitrilysin family protein [Bacteroidota bacterium]